MDQHTTIWKYQLLHKENQHIDMPGDAKVLCVQVQDGIPCLWAKVDPAAKPRTRTISVIGTGWVFECRPRAYIDTFQQAGGALVYHVFELTARGL